MFRPFFFKAESARVLLEAWAEGGRARRPQIDERVIRIMKEMLKKVSIGLVVLPLLGILMLGTATRGSKAAVQDFDAAATFKAKCAMCHGQTAEKKFDAAKADDVLENTILKGKDDVTPKMPSYEAKGVTAEQAKALAAFMKSLKK
jgi:cytochrome c553